MNIKDILAKQREGETLSDAETSFLESYDPQRDIDSAAAAARKDALKKVDELTSKIADFDGLKADLEAQLKAKADAGLSDAEKMQAQIKTLSEQIGGLNTQLEQSGKEKSAFERASTIEAIRQKTGVQFVTGINETIMTGAFASAFEGISAEQLADDAITNPIVETFKTANTGAIAAPGGHGSGAPSNVGGTTVKTGVNPFKPETENLTEQIALERDNPAEGRRLAAEAGITLEAAVA